MDKYTATWVSHTSISDFLTCPRSYYLRHVYKDPKTKHKVKLMTPHLALGQAVHEVIEALSVIPTATRFQKSLVITFQDVWKKVAGEKGGFPSTDSEQAFKSRGEDMLRGVMKDPGLLANRAVKIKESLPHYWLSEDANIILCGKIDWLEYLPDSDSVHIVDFKTGKNEEKEGSLQLPIYHLLVSNCQKRTATKASYWYLQRGELVEQTLPNLQEAHEKILEIAQQIKTARKLQVFKCPHGEKGCHACRPYEQILAGTATFVGVDEYNYDNYIIKEQGKEEGEESVIL